MKFMILQKHEILDFTREKLYFGGRVRKERSERPPRENKEDSKCSYKIDTLAHPVQKLFEFSPKLLIL